MLIYKITNNINNKVYIGQTIKKIEIRWEEHKRNSIYRNNGNEKFKRSKLYSSMNKYGLENFSIEIIEHVKEKIKMDEREIFWIKFYDSFNNGLNLTLGGESGCLGYKHTKEAKEKISQNNRTRKITEETKKRISELAKIRYNDCPEKHPRSKKILKVDFNKNIIKEFVNIDLAAKEENVDEAAIRQAVNGAKKGASCHNYFWCEKLEDLKIDKNNLNTTFYDYVQKDPITKEIIRVFNSSKEIKQHFAAKEISGVFKVIKGKQKTAYGFFWEKVLKKGLTSIETKPTLTGENKGENLKVVEYGPNGFEQ